VLACGFQSTKPRGLFVAMVLSPYSAAFRLGGKRCSQCTAKAVFARHL